MTQLKKAVEILGFAQRLTVLTGAGVSAESGVPTFRGEGGLWKKYRAEDLATPEAFRRDPALVWEWYGYRQQIVLGCSPNPAHATLAVMEGRFREFHLVTQNVDGLHLRAGSRNVTELHGNLFKARCTVEGIVTDFILGEEPLPRCGACGALLRPHIVWFGESLDRLVVDGALDFAGGCDVFLTVGTSALVQPAASLPLLAKRAGARLIEVNPDVTPITPFADASIRGRAGEILPALWEESGVVK